MRFMRSFDGEPHQKNRSEDWPLRKQENAKAKSKKLGNEDCPDASEIMDGCVCTPKQAGRNMRINRLVVGLVAVLFFVGCGRLLADDMPKGPEEDGTKPALTRIAGEGLMNSHAYQYLTELSDDIGARVTGSPAERKAEEWGAAKMKAIGLENVHLERYSIWKGWTRGTADAQLLSPTPHKLHVDAMGWTGSTVTRVAEGDVATVNLFDIDEEVKHVSRLKGKVVLVTQSGKPKKNFMLLFATFGDFLKAARDAGAIAVIGGQGGSKSTGMNLTHTGIL